MSNIDKNDLKMYPVKPDEDVYRIERELPAPLQKPPFVYLYLGSRGVGKGVCLVNELMRENMMGDREGEEPLFEDIIIFSSTLGSDETSRHLVKKASQSYETYDDSIIDEIIDYQKSKEKKDRRHILIIADDIAPILNHNASLFKLTSFHRHYLISICYLIQSPRLVPPIVRNCLTALHIFRSPNANEQDKIFSDLSFLGDKKMVKDLYDYSTNEPYQFLFVDALKNECWKWGACEPKFLWKKFNDDGGYADRFVIPKKEINENENLNQLETEEE